jgi:hydroxymethylglutaryl-CoA synthase
MIGLDGYGSYLPLYRIERETICETYGEPSESGEVTVPGHDEDVLTMAVNAAEDALEHAGATGADLDGVYVASVSDPFDERGIAAHLAFALSAPDSARVADFQGSARAAGDALVAAADALGSGRAETILVVATDALAADPGTSAERTAGAGAGAVVLREGGEIATVAGTADVTSGFVGRFKPSGESPRDDNARFHRDYGYVPDTATAIDRLSEEVGAKPDRVALPAPGTWSSRPLDRADVEATAESTFPEVGYAGAASVLLDGIACLEAASTGEVLALGAYGPGGVTAVGLEATDGADREPATPLAEYVESKEYVSYGTHRNYREAARGDA